MEGKTNSKNTRAKVEKKPNQPLKPQEQGSVKQESKTDLKTEEPREYTINTNNIVVNSKITTKDIRDSLWRCRDFELSHLWQRSIFLTTILILCFTGYGIVAMKLCDKMSSNVDLSIYTLNNIALILCIVNVIFSTLWIMMAKASKAWYERYEEAIDTFEQNGDYVNTDVIYKGETKKIKNPIGGFKYDNIKGYKSPKTDDSIFSCQGGAYSPSRINIAIGQISFYLWCIAFIIHIILSIEDFHLDKVHIEDSIPKLLCIVFIGIIVKIIIISLDSDNANWIKSQALLDARHKKKKNRT